MSREGTTLIFARKVLPRWKNRWLRRGVILLALLVSYRLLVWAALRLVDENEMARRLDEWLEQTLVAEASIQRVDAGMSLAGQTHFTIHSLTIKHPNDLFQGNFLSVDPLRFNCPLTGLWGVPCTPELRLRALNAHITWKGDAYDACSLYGLADPLDPPQQPAHFPIPLLNAPTVQVQLGRGRLTLERLHRHETITIPLSGQLTYDMERQRLSGSLEPTSVSCEISGDSEKPHLGRIHVTRLVAEPMRLPTGEPAIAGEWEARLESLPIHLFNILWPKLLPDLQDFTVSGGLSYHRGAIRFEGALGGYAPASLVRGPLSLSASRARDGHWSPLEARCEFLNLDQLPAPAQAGRQVWLDQLLGVFDAVELNADELQLLGVPIQRANLRLGRLKGQEALVGLILKGETFGQLEGDTGELPVPLGIPAIRWAPAGGLVEVIITHTPPESSTPGEPVAVWSGAATLKNLNLPTRNAGALFRELANIPLGLHEVELLRRKAMEEEPLAKSLEVLPLGALIFTEVSIVYRTFTDGTNRLLLSGTSPEFGNLLGRGQRNPDGTFSLALAFREIPESVLTRNPALHPDTRAAVLTQAKSEEGLRLDLTVTPEGETVKRRYVQDVFHVWLKQHTQANASTPEAATPSEQPRIPGASIPPPPAVE